ncbi:hypothetical protein [Photorhabdus luminescens]|uniref:Lipoprotein n=1 Tax=Photorhabdus luminescens subsp. mexicana TaxID=2100167 RepID=A0A4R4J400_PHOLU|nr:hypothetical protein [Photorhabdus luminescens]TDB48086.1 hypothetical protein C5468_16925 [Photorhabdus luminescens subsp. mexicana]
MKKSLLSIILFLSGCSLNPSDMRKSNPYAEFESNKSVDLVSKCIASGLETRSYAGVATQVYFRPMSNGMSISTVGNVEMIDILSKDSKTLVKYYSAYTHTWTLGNQDRIDAVLKDIKLCI